MLEKYQCREGFLQKLNPVIKLGGLMAVVLVMMTVMNPWVPLVMIVLAGVALRLLGGVPVTRFLLYLSPFSLFALSFLWINVLFPAERGDTVLFSIGPVDIAQENVLTGLSLGLRSLVFASWSLLFVLTTEPTRLMLGLIQHCKLAPRFGYGLMAAYRFLPLFREELQQVRAAHRIRGLGETGGLAGKWRQMKRYSIPLLASAVRKAERVAVAMESKGFDDSPDRVFYRRIGWSWKDVVSGSFLLLLLAAIFMFR